MASARYTAFSIQTAILSDIATMKRGRRPGLVRVGFGSPENTLFFMNQLLAAAMNDHVLVELRLQILQTLS